MPARSILTAAVLLTASFAPPPPGCTGVPNGDFVEGLAGWDPKPSVAGEGAHLGDAAVAVVDQTLLGGDADVACLSVVARAGPSAGAAACASRMAISTHAVVTGPRLVLRTGGTFEVVIYGHVAVAYAARATVRGRDGKRAELQILVDAFESGLSCGTGQVGLGVLPTGEQELDVAAAGFRPGDEVEVEVSWSASTRSFDACAQAWFEGALCVDEIAFCD